MSSLKEIKSRISSVNTTLKITAAMKMVASAKLHKAQRALERMLPYEKRMRDILMDLLAAENGGSGEYFSSQDRHIGKIALVCFSSDSSLCGSFNSSVIKKALEVISEYREAGAESISVYSIGRKMRDAMREKDYVSLYDRSHLFGKRTYAEASGLAKELSSSFRYGSFDKIELIYPHFKSIANQAVVREPFLPLEKLPSGKKDFKIGVETRSPYILEPGKEELTARLIPEYLNLKMYAVLSDSAAAEHAARTVAMQTATDNGEELLQELTLEYNKGRQQKITDELLDMIGGTMQ